MIIVDFLWTVRMLVCGLCADALLMMIRSGYSDSCTVGHWDYTRKDFGDRSSRHGSGASGYHPRAGVACCTVNRRGDALLREPNTLSPWKGAGWAVLMLDKQAVHPCAEIWERARLVCTVRKGE
jgi:hypothetical protein